MQRSAAPNRLLAVVERVPAKFECFKIAQTLEGPAIQRLTLAKPPIRVNDDRAASGAKSPLSVLDPGWGVPSLPPANDFGAQAAGRAIA